MLQGDDSKKNISRTFRLRSGTLTALEALSEKNDISQNEVLNIILTESYEDFVKLERAEKLLKDPDTEMVILTRRYNNNIGIEFDVTPTYECTMKVVKFSDSGNKGKLLDSVKFHIKDIYELLDYGVNSTFIGTPKMKEK